MVRATGLHPVGHRFESCAVHHLIPLIFSHASRYFCISRKQIRSSCPIAGLFSGRGFNIDTLNVAPTHSDGRSRITATLNGDEKALDQCIKQLDKLVDVIRVENYHGDEAVGRELVLLKVDADSKTRSEITQICDVFRGKIIDVAPTSLIIEATGNENKIKAFLNCLNLSVFLSLPVLVSYRFDEDSVKINLNGNYTT